MVTDQASGRRASRVQVYGVDDRFWRFHGVDRVGPVGPRRAAAAGARLGHRRAATAARVLVRVERPSAIPLESLHGRKEDLGRTLRLTVRAIVPRDAVGEFSLRPQQGDVRAVFVPLARLQQDLDARRPRQRAARRGQRSRRATQSIALPSIVTPPVALEDVGLTRADARRTARAIAVESAAGVLDAPQAPRRSTRPHRVGLQPRAGPHLSGEHASAAAIARCRIRWSPRLDLPRSRRCRRRRADRLRVRRSCSTTGPRATRRAKSATRSRSSTTSGRSPAGSLTRTAEFRVAAVVPIAGPPPIATWRRVYPGHHRRATRSATGIRRFRSISSACGRHDEDYWKQYRTTPKAFIPFEVGQTAVALALRRPHVGALARRRPASRSTRRAIATRPRCARARSAGRGSGGSRRARRGSGRLARRDRFRRVLRLLQFLPRRLGARARGAVLQARRRAARARGRPAARGRLRPRGVRRLFSPKGCVLAVLGSLARRRRRRRLRAR